ncbi:hypothetical protein IFM51744_10959 [Aspergillus udagawae]|nr:hypothetical protein IFM51744_10959 [Aspergillus udagawae]
MPPPPESAPVTGLPIYPGYRCPRCPYVARAAGSSFFQVTPLAQVEQMKQAATITGPEFIQAQVRAQLQEALAEEAELDAVVPAPTQKHLTEVSPGWSSPSGHTTSKGRVSPL